MTEAQTPLRIAEPQLRQTGIGLNYLGFTGSMGLAALGDASWYIALTWTLGRNVGPAVEGSLLAVASRTVGMVLAVGVLVVVVAVVATQQWGLLLVLAAMLLAVPAASIFRVSVDRSGLRWSSALGWPRGRIALEDVVETAVVQVRPGDFGGFGLRSAPGATGLITRSGEALSVTHGPSRRRLVVTVDDALTAASVLEGLRRRSPTR